MILRYLYIKKWSTTVNNLDINLGGRYEFLYNEGRLIAVEAKEYVGNIYSRFSNIADVTAIIGKNSSGKTTILKLISSAFGNTSSSFQYIAVFQNKDESYSCYTKMDTPIRIDADCISHEEKIAAYMSLGDILSFGNKTKLIYFSNIFDKNKPLPDHEYLIDISTNREITKYISSREYLNKINNIKLKNRMYNFIEDYFDIDDGLKEEIYENLSDFINDNDIMNFENDVNIIEHFKQKEDLKKVRYMIEFKKALVGTEDSSLFPFPRKVFLKFSDNENVQRLLHEIYKADYDEYYYIRYIEDTITNLFIDDSEDGNKKVADTYFNDDKECFINEFLYYLIVEVLISLIGENALLVKDALIALDDYLMSEEYNISGYIDKILSAALQKDIKRENGEENKDDIDDKTEEEKHFVLNDNSGPENTAQYIEKTIDIIETYYSEIHSTRLEELILAVFKEVETIDNKNDIKYITLKSSILQQVSEYDEVTDDDDKYEVLDQLLELLKELRRDEVVETSAIKGTTIPNEDNYQDLKDNMQRTIESNVLETNVIKLR